ncbi:SHOCT domain-containing protein [Nocardioides sp. GXQ0305]|uniref:SHOCT domain-containing protein n=1 Tax=Nocardioides sp. GXQ0305 TaxID=3423912 RepID=UPI003D7CFA4A
MSFWDIVWFLFISFAFIAYLMVLFSIFSDLFRDSDTSGFVKAIWIVLLVLLPLVTSLVYVIARGPGMARRNAEGLARQRRDQEAYIRDVAGQGSSSPADQIARARELLDADLISQADYERLKEKALT